MKNADENKLLRGDIPPDEYVRRIPTEGPGHCNSIISFSWVADHRGFLDWMHRLHWQPAVYNIGYDKAYAIMLEKVGVFVNLHQNTACTAEQGWMSVADGVIGAARQRAGPRALGGGPADRTGF